VSEIDGKLEGLDENLIKDAKVVYGHLYAAKQIVDSVFGNGTDPDVVFRVSELIRSEEVVRLVEETIKARKHPKRPISKDAN